MNLQHRCRSVAFSLVELLAAMSVLTVLVLMLTQITALVSETWRGGKARTDSFSQARNALDVIERDIRLMVQRSDIAAFKGKNIGDRACAFYTLTSGKTGNRALALVNYYLDESATEPKLKRAALGFGYEVGSSQVLPLGSEVFTDLPSDPANDPIVASCVIKFEWQFLDGNGDLNNNFVFDHAIPQAITNTRAVVLSLLVLDQGAYDLAKKTEKLAKLIEKLDGTPSNLNESYAGCWRAKTNKPTFRNGLPLPVSQGVKVFEKTIPLPIKP